VTACLTRRGRHSGQREEECGRQSWEPYLERRALDIHQVDISRNGFTDANNIKQRVEEKRFPSRKAPP
jgi:hypothetical protein